MTLRSRMKIAKRCFVSGRVQGVFYRASTRQEAERLSVRGHARNLDDGRVEVLAVGAPESVQALIDWLWRGSPASHVTGVEIEDLAKGEVRDIPQRFLTL